LRESVSVKDFGAVGDGVADDTAAIQAAIDAINAAGGGDVLFPTGKYSITSQLTIRNSVALRGSIQTQSPDNGATIIASANMTNMLSHDQTSGATIFSFSIFDLRLDGNKANFTVNNILNIRGVNCRIMRSRIQNATDKGIFWQGFDDGGFAWINWIESNTIGGCGEAGIYFKGTDSRILNNYISGNGDNTTGAGYGIYMYSSGGTVISNNMIDLCGEGLALRRSDVSEAPSNVVVANYFDQNYHGITLDKESPAQAGGLFGRHIISSNLFKNTGSAAVSGDPYDLFMKIRCDDTLISSNRFNSSTTVTANIKFDSLSRNLTVVGNSFNNATSIVDLSTNESFLNVLSGNVGIAEDLQVRTLSDKRVNAPAGLRSKQSSIINDDNVLVLTPSYKFGCIFVNAAGNTGIFNFDALTSPLCQIVAQNATTFEATTGILTGTTGTNGKITVSAASNGNIYIENRLGANFSINVSYINNNDDWT
jgi:parallel beta-helix repeat protein